MKGFKSSVLECNGVAHLFGTKHVTPEECLKEVSLPLCKGESEGVANDLPPLIPPYKGGRALDPHTFFIPNTKQVHGGDVHVIDDAWGGELQYGDGWVTNRTGVAAFVYTADCVPVLLCDPVNRVIGAVHCGWRSMAAGIAENAVAKMCGLGADKDMIRVAIGPSICADCYEVGSELREAFSVKGVDVGRHFKPHTQNKYLMHLTGICRELYLNAGLESGNIDDLCLCTRCNPDLFVSYRRDVGTDDRQVSLIAIV